VTVVVRNYVGDNNERGGRVFQRLDKTLCEY
jgi:hypothetical protein